MRTRSYQPVPSDRSLAAYLTMSLWGVVAAGCSNDGTDTNLIERSDSSGVEIVMSDAADRRLDWTLEPILTLGGKEEGPEAFYEVTRELVSVDGSGNIFVLDRHNFRVIQFSPAGMVSLVVGQKGSGPGEFARPIGISAGEDGSFMVLDAGKGSIEWFGTAGSPGTRVKVGRVRSQFSTSVGALVLHGQRYTREGYQEFLVRVQGGDTLELASTQTAEIRNYRIESCGGGGPGSTGPVIFAPELRWDSHQSTLVVNSEPGYVVNVYDISGQLRRSVRRGQKPRVATVELAEAWAVAHPWKVTRSLLNGDVEECVAPASEVVEKRGYAEFVAQVGRIALAPNGAIWVERYVLGVEESPIDVFDSNGAYLGTLSNTFPMPLTFTPLGDLLLSERDESDVERLVVARVVVR